MQRSIARYPHYYRTNNIRVFDFPGTVSAVIVAMVIASLSRGNKLEVILIHCDRLKAICNSLTGKSLHRFGSSKVAVFSAYRRS